MAWMARHTGGVHGTWRERIGSLALGAISLLFVVAAIWMLVRGERGVEAWLALLFFGSCFLIFVAGAMDARYARRGGSRVLVTAINVVAMGGFCVAVLLFGLAWPDIHWLLRAFMIACGAVGIVGTVALAFRRVVGGGTKLVLAREGVVHETRRATLLLLWEHIERVEVGEVHRNVSLLMWLAPEPPRVLASRDSHDRVLARRARDRAACGVFAGCAWYVMQHMVDEPLGPLAERITAAIDDPVERAALPPYTS